jgi:hypothetical protein
MVKSQVSDTRSGAAGKVSGEHLVFASVASIAISVVALLVGLHLFNEPWPWAAGFVALLFGLCLLLPWERGAARHVASAVMILLLAVLVVGGGIAGHQRYTQQAPARAAAAQVAAARGQAAAVMARATTQATNQLADQGFIGDASGDPPTVTLSSPTSGVVDIMIASGDFYFSPELPIQKIGKTWVAGCPTIVPGVMYPLSGKDNAVAISLNNSGHCPAGISPPSSSSAGAGG